MKTHKHLFEKRFIEDSYACRPGTGTQAGMRRAAQFAKRFPYVLKCAVRRYFPSIEHEVMRGLAETAPCSRGETRKREPRDSPR